jgi:hypothetical protein
MFTIASEQRDTSRGEEEKGRGRSGAVEGDSETMGRWGRWTRSHTESSDRSPSRSQSQLHQCSHATPISSAPVRLDLLPWRSISLSPFRSLCTPPALLSSSFQRPVVSVVPVVERPAAVRREDAAILGAVRLLVSGSSRNSERSCLQQRAWLWRPMGFSFSLACMPVMLIDSAPCLPSAASVCYWRPRSARVSGSATAPVVRRAERSKRSQSKRAVCPLKS